MILNLASLGAALLALGLSSVLTFRQSVMMRHANEVPLLLETFKEYRSPVYQRHEHYVVTELAQRSPPELGVSGLPEESRIAATSIVTFFNVLGALLIYDMADEKLIVPLFGYRAAQAWGVLEPYIMRERRNRKDDIFAAHFEDLICRVRDHSPPLAAYGLRLRRLPPESAPDGPAAGSA